MRGVRVQSTSSMTSVPKPLKFLAPHYGPLKRAFREMGGFVRATDDDVNETAAMFEARIAAAAAAAAAALKAKKEAAAEAAKA